MLKGQDVLLMLLLRTKPKSDWTFQLLSHETGLSVSQCHSAIGRLKISGLLSRDLSDQWRVPGANCLEFLAHGLKYFFPAEIGPQARGIPTATSATFVRKHFLIDESKFVGYVWPDPEGPASGSGIRPIHPCQMRFVPPENGSEMFDPSLYETLVCIDLLRMGRAREKAWAMEELKGRLHVGR